MAPKKNVGLTLVEEESQGEEQENTSDLHGGGDVLLSTAERNWDAPGCVRDPDSGTLLGPLYLSPLLAPHHRASSTLQGCGDNIQSMGTAAGGTWLIGGRKDESSAKPMEETILICSQGWGPVPGVGVSPGSALL